MKAIKQYTVKTLATLRSTASVLASLKLYLKCLRKMMSLFSALCFIGQTNSGVEGFSGCIIQGSGHTQQKYSSENINSTHIL